MVDTGDVFKRLLGQFNRAQMNFVEEYIQNAGELALWPSTIKRSGCVPIPPVETTCSVPATSGLVAGTSSRAPYCRRALDILSPLMTVEAHEACNLVEVFLLEEPTAFYSVRIGAFQSRQRDSC